MSNQYTIVTLAGEPVAMAGDGEAEIVTGLDEHRTRTVAAMCLFALEVQAGAIDSPYTNERALAYAQLALGKTGAGRARS